MAKKNDQKMIFSKGQAGNNTLKELMSKAELHLQAEQLVLSAIPPELAGGTRFVSYREGELVLSADNASNATRLRFRQQEIMSALRENEPFRYVWKIKIKVSPPRFTSQRKPVKEPLSKENARLLQEEAGHTKDKALREVLEKLASHVRD